MIQLLTCSRCTGFLAVSLEVCPHCGATLPLSRRVALAVAGLTGGGIVSMTMMACYGAPCTDDSPCIVPETPDAMMPDDAGIDTGANRTD